MRDNPRAPKIKCVDRSPNVMNRGNTVAWWRLIFWGFCSMSTLSGSMCWESISLVWLSQWDMSPTVYPKKYAHGFVVICFVVVMQSFIMNSHEVFILILQGCFAGTGAIVKLPQCQWSKPDGYGKISQCITTTKHSTAKTVCIFLGIYCSYKQGGNFNGFQAVIAPIESDCNGTILPYIVIADFGLILWTLLYWRANWLKTANVFVWMKTIILIYIISLYDSLLI